MFKNKKYIQKKNQRIVCKHLKSTAINSKVLIQIVEKSQEILNELNYSNINSYYSVIFDDSTNIKNSSEFSDLGLEETDKEIRSLKIRITSESNKSSNVLIIEMNFDNTISSELESQNYFFVELEEEVEKKVSLTEINSIGINFEKRVFSLIKKYYTRNYIYQRIFEIFSKKMNSFFISKIRFFRFVKESEKVRYIMLNNIKIMYYVLAIAFLIYGYLFS